MKIDIYTNVKTKAHLDLVNNYVAEHNAVPSENTLNSIFCSVIKTDSLDFNPATVAEVAEAVEMNLGLVLDEDCTISYPCEMDLLLEICALNDIGIMSVDNSLVQGVKDAKVQLLAIVTGNRKIILVSLPITTDFMELSKRIPETYLLEVRRVDASLPLAPDGFDNALDELRKNANVFRSEEDIDTCAKNKVLYTVKYLQQEDFDVSGENISCSYYAGSTLAHALSGVPFLK